MPLRTAIILIVKALVDKHQRFGGTCCFQHHCLRESVLLLHSSILKVPLSSEMSVPIYQSARYSTPEARSIRSHHRETQTPLKQVASLKIVSVGFVSLLFSGLCCSVSTSR